MVSAASFFVLPHQKTRSHTTGCSSARRAKNCSCAGPFDTSVSVLILPHYRRNHFKHFACYCPQRGAAIKRGIDAVAIVIINSDYLLPDSAAGKGVVSKRPQVLEIFVILSQRFS
jgi:hypothetical protein